MVFQGLFFCFVFSFLTELKFVYWQTNVNKITKFLRFQIQSSAATGKNRPKTKSTSCQLETRDKSASLVFSQLSPCALSHHNCLCDSFSILINTRNTCMQRPLALIGIQGTIFSEHEVFRVYDFEIVFICTLSIFFKKM